VTTWPGRGAGTRANTEGSAKRGMGGREDLVSVALGVGTSRG
jgi:hypothetical protein